MHVVSKYPWIGRKQICKSCNRRANQKPINCSEPGHQIYYERVLREHRRMQKTRYKLNPKPTNDYQKDYRKKKVNANKLWMRKAHLKHAYGLSIEQVDYILLDQNYLCPVCGKPLKKRNFNTGHAALDIIYYVDHDHETGKVRGLICFRCNTGLGWIEETGTDFILGKIKNYLGRNLFYEQLAKSGDIEK